MTSALNQTNKLTMSINNLSVKDMFITMSQFIIISTAFFLAMAEIGVIEKGKSYNSVAEMELAHYQKNR